MLDRRLATAIATSLAACGVDTEHAVPAFTVGHGGTGEVATEGGSGEVSGGDEVGDDGGGEVGGEVGGPVDEGGGVDTGGGQVDEGGGVDGNPIDDDAGSDDDGPPTDLPYDPLYRIAVRVHVGESTMSDDTLLDVLSEMNFIWRSQAAVCFEFEVVEHDTVMTDGFDMWFKPEIGAPNGYYTSDHDIAVRDVPNLSSAPNPAMNAAARTAAHELGHGLTLEHDQNSDDYLMRSGTYGWQLPQYQLDASRNRAAVKALADTTLPDCDEPIFAD